jgi:hypothetical protein
VSHNSTVVEQVHGPIKRRWQSIMINHAVNMGNKPPYAVIVVERDRNGPEILFSGAGETLGCWAPSTTPLTRLQSADIGYTGV